MSNPYDLEAMHRLHGPRLTAQPINPRITELEAENTRLREAICPDGSVQEAHALVALAEAHRADSERVDAAEAEIARLRIWVKQVAELEREMWRCVDAEKGSVLYFARSLELLLERGTEQP